MCDLRDALSGNDSVQLTILLGEVNLEGVDYKKGEK